MHSLLVQLCSEIFKRHLTKGNYYFAGLLSFCFILPTNASYFAMHELQIVSLPKIVFLSHYASDLNGNWFWVDLLSTIYDQYADTFLGKTLFCANC